MSEIRLLPCPVCNGKSVKLNEFYETSDGLGDRWPSIECKCGLSLSLTTDEFYAAQDDFGYTGGYYSENKKFWNGMHQRLIGKWNTRKPMQEIVERLEGRAEQEMNKSEKAAELGKAYERHTILHGGKGMAFEDAIEIVKEVGGMNGDD